MTPGAWIAGKYCLLRPLGKGSMGEVWAARHAEMDREVALKLIYRDTPDTPDFAARLKREAQACGKLQHPNIVRVYDIGETEEGDPFLVMEMLEGETLRARIAGRRRLPLGEALEITLAVARALRAAHGVGVIHRDLKPENVFLHVGAEAEEVKVVDFGVSKILSLGNLSFTVSGALVGSPAYMSPEQARALKDVDGRADLWSLGVLLFEMLSGRRPFTSEATMGVITEILSAPIPSLSAVLPGVDPRLEEVVSRCLTRDLDQRMPSAAALIGMLRPLHALVAADGGRRPAPSLLESAQQLPVFAFPPAPLPRIHDDDDDDAPTVLHPSSLRAASERAAPRAADGEDEKETVQFTSSRSELFRAVAARAAAAASPEPPPAGAPGDQGTERIPGQQALLYQIAAIRASQSNNPVVQAALPRPGVVTALMTDAPPASPTWQAASGSTHPPPPPSPRWPGLADEAEKTTQVMLWKQGNAQRSRSLLVGGVAAGLALALVVTVGVVLARCGPDDETAGAHPGGTAAPASTHR